MSFQMKINRYVKEEQSCKQNAPLLQQLCVALQQSETDGSEYPPTSLTFVVESDRIFGVL
jgi:hypothetical protein